MSQITDTLRIVRVFNDHEFFDGSTSQTDSQVYVDYVPKAGFFHAHTLVIRRGYHTDPSAHWNNRGCKSFDIGNRTQQREAAIAWASERYGITEWARSPFGGYGDAAFIKARVKTLKQQAREQTDAQVRPGA